MSRPVRSSARLARDDRGAVYVEFLIAFIPLFLMVLGIAQHAMLLAANLVVEHAAVRAARSAIVVLDDDPALYGGEPRLEIDTGKRDGAGHLGSSVTDLMSSRPEVGGSRMKPIRTSAYGPLLALAPDWRQIMTRDEKQSVFRAVDGRGPSRLAVGVAYNLGATAVTFPTAPGADTYRSKFHDTDDVTVRVTYLYHCAIPLASRLMCDSMLELKSGLPIRAYRDAADRYREGSLTLSDVQFLREQIRTQRGRLRAMKPRMRELATAEESWLQPMLILGGSRFRILTAEATLTIHKAPYRYRSERSGGGES